MNIRNIFFLQREQLFKIPGTRGQRPQAGQSLVELALTLTLLITLLAGAFDLGSAFLDYIAMRDAAQEGAVYGSVFRNYPSDPTTITPIVSRVQQSSNKPIDFNTFVYSSDCSNTANGICIGFSNGSLCAGDEIIVTVQYEYPLSMPFIGVILATNTIPLKASVTNVLLTPYCN